MHIAILHNCDHDLLANDPGREARLDVVRVAQAMAAALGERGHTPELIAAGPAPFSFLERLRRQRPDAVVNLCESLEADSRGEMAVPFLLDLLGLPYTGSGGLALGLALHKHKAKELLRARGVPTPDFRLVSHLDEVVGVDLAFPLIVKPSREDASVGVTFDSVVENRASLSRAVMRVLRTFHQPALVEAFIPGREIYVPLLGNRPARALPLSEIHFGKAFEDRPKIVSYRAKWEPSSDECVDSPSGPCALEPALEEKIIRTAREAFEALECRDYGRVDIRLTPDGRPYVIDINPNCDLHPEAGFAKAAARDQLSYPELASQLVEIALERHHGNTPARRIASGTARRAAVANRNVLTRRGELRARARRSRAQAE